MLIGLDLDNTIIDYDDAFCEVGRRLGMLPAAFLGTKRDVRAHLWQSEAGDLAWQRLQAAVYGPGIGEARPADGALAFMAAARAAGHGLAIVSHKSRFAAADPGGTDLRQSARAWLADSGIAERLVASEAVFFEDTRAAKLARIGALGCRYFVDDLEEVLLDPAFPATTEGVHFAPGHPPGGQVPRRFAGWAEIAAHILGAEQRRTA